MKRDRGVVIFLAGVILYSEFLTTVFKERVK